jgi:hypothetical protein
MRILVDYTDPEADMYEWEFAVHDIPAFILPIDEYGGPAGIKMRKYDRDEVPERVWTRMRFTLVSNEDECLELFKELPEEQRNSIVEYSCQNVGIDEVGYDAFMWSMILTAVKMWKCDAVWYIHE